MTLLKVVFEVVAVAAVNALAAEFGTEALVITIVGSLVALSALHRDSIRAALGKGYASDAKLGRPPAVTEPPLEVQPEIEQDRWGTKFFLHVKNPAGFGVASGVRAEYERISPALQWQGTLPRPMIQGNRPIDGPHELQLSLSPEQSVVYHVMDSRHASEQIAVYFADRGERILGKAPSMGTVTVLVTAHNRTARREQFLLTLREGRLQIDLAPRVKSRGDSFEGVG